MTVENKPLAVHAAIVQVMDEVGKEGVGKNHSADFGGAKRNYRGIDDIYNALNRAMVRAKLAIIPSVAEKTVERFERENQYKKMVTTHVYSMVIDYKVICAVDSSFEIMRIFIEGFDTSDKGTGKAFSYAYKCGVLQLFCIPVEGQEDQDAHDPKIERTPTPTPASESRPEPARAKAAETKTSDADVQGAVAKTMEEPPRIPYLIGKAYKDKRVLIDTLESDEAVINYVRSLMHAKDADAASKNKFQEYWADRIAEAMVWANEARGITDFSKSKAERAKQLQAAVSDKHEFSDEMYLCAHPDALPDSIGKRDIRGWHNAEHLLEYSDWLRVHYNQPTQTARIQLVEERVAQLVLEEAKRADEALAKTERAALAG